MSELSVNWMVRPPWPDETYRLAHHFTVQFAEERGNWHRVIEAADPQRIVGFAALQELNRPAELRLLWEIRLEWQAHAATEALLDLALKQARDMGARTVVTNAVPEATLAQLAVQRGFKEISRQEVWSIPVAPTLSLLEERGGPLLARSPVVVSPLVQSNLEQVRKICANAHLLTPESVRPRTPGIPAGFDPGLSFCAGDLANPGIVLLAREHFGKAYLEVIARNPEAVDFPHTGVIALMRAFYRAVAELGLEEVTCAITSGNNFGLVPLTRRAGARCTEAVASFRIDL
ncbi:MAG: hypothetical protein JWL59_2855 [Chthoniobacteraceae bacterium]|nr:hypothetical protein [Chthoniobacteraceae bacterium]